MLELVAALAGAATMALILAIAYQRWGWAPCA